MRLLGDGDEDVDRDCAYRSAWFMAHRIRLAMDASAPSALGGEGKFVEADETYIGGKARNRKGKTPKKEAVFSLVVAEVEFGKVADAGEPLRRGDTRHRCRVSGS